MTPKEKAEELVKKFGTYAVMWSGGIEVEKQNVKQCALIAVDEILQIKSITMYPVLEDNYIYGHEEYWQKVKEKIENI